MLCRILWNNKIIEMNTTQLQKGQRSVTELKEIKHLLIKLREERWNMKAGVDKST